MAEAGGGGPFVTEVVALLPAPELGSVHPAHEESPHVVWLGSPKGPSYRSSRLTGPQKRKIKGFCLGRDGSKCGWCRRGMPENDRSIHHIDHDSTNHYSTNLELMHLKCNMKEVAASKRSVVSTQVRSGMDTHIPKSLQNTEPIAINQAKEPIFRQCVFERIKKDKEKGNQYRSQDGYDFSTRSKKDLVSSASGFARVSVTTGKRYMVKLVSPNSPNLRELHMPLIVMKDGDDEYVAFWNTKDYDLSIPELLAKYPMNGMLESTDKSISGFLDRES